MSDHEHHAHPTTFTEIISDGFPLHLITEEASAHHPVAERIEASTDATRANRLDRLAVPVVRMNQSKLSSDEKNAYKDAVNKLVLDGTYLRLVQVHMDMRHNMHGSMGLNGLYRFLGWHRRYLVAFERELQRVAQSSGSAPIGVPYWDWTGGFPDWLVDFLPQSDPDSGNAPAPRTLTAPPELPSADDVKLIVEEFQQQQTGIPNENDYTKFTYALEGWGRRPDGTGLPAHNHGHAWIGGIMNNTRTSPTDPAFWLHHAQIDRLLEIWLKKHAASKPALVGMQRIMDPWAESYDDLLDISVLSYSYDSLAL